MMAGLEKCRNCAKFSVRPGRIAGFEELGIFFIIVKFCFSKATI